MKTIGIDTSNYATSVAVFDSAAEDPVFSVKIPLVVREGELGLRQNDAVFAHDKNLPLAFSQLRAQIPLHDIAAIGVSARPRDVEGSYMPCFLSGSAAAGTLSAVMDCPVYSLSHQAGHVMAALYGTHRHRIKTAAFRAFHVSGGTTDALDCALDGAAMSIQCRATSLDLFAGQVVDRVGAMLGLAFPAGPAFSALAEFCDTQDYAKPVLKGADCCLSGLENQCAALKQAERKPSYIARYCLNSIAEVIRAMTDALDQDGDRPEIIGAGGVLSSSVVRGRLSREVPHMLFCDPSWLSADNAVGTAILAWRAEEMQ